LIEANQRGYRSAVLGKDVKARRARSSSAYVAIADRCLQRLNKKGNRRLLAGKHPNQVKVACARDGRFCLGILEPGGSGVAVAGWNVRSIVDLNASADLEGKTEIGKSTHPSLEERAEHQHAVPVDR